MPSSLNYKLSNSSRWCATCYEGEGSIVRVNGPGKMNDKKVDVAYEIVQYLIKHPDAQDTLDGIVDWWFLEKTIKHPKLLVEKALDMLVKDGLVIKHHGTDCRTVYKLYRPRRKK